MSFVFEELDFQHTPLGDISLRKRGEPRLGGKIVYALSDIETYERRRRAETHSSILGSWR